MLAIAIGELQLFNIGMNNRFDAISKVANCFHLVCGEERVSVPTTVSG